MIHKTYILFSRISINKNDSGEYFCDPLWAKDIKEHLRYISDFNLCCPVQNNNNNDGLVKLDDFGITCIYELNKDFGLKSVLKNIIPNFKMVRSVCKKAHIVHSGGAGWAFPLSFYILFLKPFITFKWIIVIESSFWMMDKKEKKTFRKVIEHYTHKFLLTRCVSQANARIFTQSFYRNYFLGNNIERTLINPATWVNKDNIVSSEDIGLRFSQKKNRPISIIYPTRLVKEKGVLVVFEALNKLKDIDVEVHLTIIGAGPLEAECQKIAMINYNNLKVEFRKPVEYGKDFFNLLAEYDYVLVPTIKEEQPRIIFDAFSQGVAVIASNTSGILDITNDCNAFIFSAGESTSLANIIKLLANKSDTAHKMGLSGLAYAKDKTHKQMHKDRQKFLEETLK